MKTMLKNALLLVIATAILCTQFPTVVFAATPQKCYTISGNGTTVYKNAELTEKDGKIDGKTEITINKVKKKYTKVTYPISGGKTKTGYVHTNAILINTTGNTYKSNGEMTAYKRPGDTSYGHIATGDKIMVLGTYKNYTQVRYFSSGRYKYAFVSTAKANEYIIKKPVLTSKSGTVAIGETKNIKIENALKATITYKSKNNSIATVSKEGEVTGTQSGSTEIIVTVKKDGQKTKLTYKVSVKKPMLSDESLSLRLGETVNLAVKDKPKEAKYTWSSSNNKIATVNNNGTVTAESEGTATITVEVKTSKETYDLSCKVAVKSMSEKPPEITINDLSDTQSNNVNTETIDVSGTSKTYSGSISKVTYSLRFVLEETASVNGEAVGTTNWKIESIPLQIGTNFLTITVVDSENKTTSKEIILNRINKEIELSENVVLYTDDQTSLIANDIVDYWVDDMGTPDDTYDDQIKVLFRENSEIVQSIKSGSLVVGNVIMLQPCEELYLGFNGVLVSNEESEDTQKYNPSEYEVVTFTSADYTDIFTGDISLSYELTNTENPIAFAYFPSDVEIYSMNDTGKKLATLYSNNDKEVSAYATENIGDQTVEQVITGAGFQKSAISYMMNDALNVTGGLSGDSGINIGIKLKDTVLFDADGSKDTVNDQFKFGGSISYKNLKVDAGIEWHPNFNPFNLDLLPQQVMGKYSYTEEIDAHADWTGKINLKVKDDDGKEIGLVEAANKLRKNDFENNIKFMGMTLSGVDMSDSIILGAVGLLVSPVKVAPTFGINTAQSSSKSVPLSAVIVIMPVLNVDGEISTKVGFTYNYSSYHEEGINMQKKDYVGAYGSLDDNRGQYSIELPFDRSLEVYNVCSKSSDDKSSDPVWSSVFKIEGKCEERVAIGADIGLMVAGIMPTSVEGKLYENAKADLNGQIKVGNENGFALDGSAEIDAKIGAMAETHFKLAASTALFSPEIKCDKKWDKVLWEVGLTTASIDGSVFKADTDTDNSNNEKMSDVLVKLKRTDKLGQPEQTTSTDSEGKYQFTNVLEGKYKLSFVKDGFDTYESDKFTMSSSDKSMDIYLSPSIHSTLSGKVTEADTDTDTTNNIPLSDVNISVSLANNLKNITKNAKTDVNGTYSVSDLPVGLYNVTFTKDGYIKTVQTFEVAEGVKNYYNTIIESISNEHSGKGTASGTISDYLTGHGIENLTLNIRSGTGTKSGSIVSTTTSSIDGKYVTSGLQAGSYTIEIVDNRPNVSERYLTNYFNIKIMGNMNIGNQNGAVGTGLVSDQLRIVLRWGSSPSDLDSHLVGPTLDGKKFHIYFDDKTYYESDIRIADLDLDDTSSWGPETTTIYNPVPGTYKFCVHDYSNKNRSNNVELANSGAYVQIYKGISAVPEYELYVPQGTGTVWNVFEYNAETGNINIINTLTHQSHSDDVGLASLSDGTSLALKIFDDVYIEPNK